MNPHVPRESSTTEEVRTERMATGGEAVARLDDGCVVFVRGAMSDEVVRVSITERKKRFARATVTKVVTASPQRHSPGCVHHNEGQCGGCDWMFVSPSAQRDYKQAIVIEQLERLGGVEAPQVTTPDMPRGHRSTVRCAVTNGRAGYRGRRSEASFVASTCQAAHPLLEELIVHGSFGNASEVTLRVGALTGERLVITNGDPATVKVPDGVSICGSDDHAGAVLHEEVAGRRWRISAGSFFQTSQEGAEALVAAVGRSLADTEGDVVDLYGGVGLLGGGAGVDRLTCMVESNPSSIDDARHNLGTSVDVVQSRVERWKPTPFGTVIADPARRGLAAEGVAVVSGTGANSLVLVSCDPASLGRDSALLQEQGWRYDRGEVIDMFPDTSRCEVVSLFVR